MKELQLNVNGTDELKKAVLDLLVTNKAFYKLVLELADRTDNDAGRLYPDDLETFVSYLAHANYYTAELLYMAQLAMDDVTAD